MPHNEYNPKQISTISRKGFEAWRDELGLELARAMILCSRDIGRMIIREEYMDRLRAALQDDCTVERVRRLIRECDTLVGIAEKNNQVMQTEIAFYGAQVPLDFGMERLTWKDFLHLHFNRIVYPGSHTLIRGWKGEGKTNMALALADYARKRGYVVSVNIPLVAMEEGYENVYEQYQMSELLQLRSELTPGTPMLHVIDEADQTWAKILGATREHKNLNKWDKLTRHFDISTVSIWHPKKDIPDPLMEQVENEKASLVVKKQKETATVDGIVKCNVTHIPKADIEYLSKGTGSSQTFYMDVDVTKATRQLVGVKDEEQARELLRRAVRDQTIILEDYVDEDTDEQSLYGAFMDVLDDLQEYVTHTGRTIDDQKLQHSLGVNRDEARYIRNELMRRVKQSWSDFDNDLTVIPDGVVDDIRQAIQEKYE